MAAYAGEGDEEELVGYIFSTLDVLRAPGYSSTPFDVVAGVTLGGRVTGAAVLFHHEPYLLNDERRTSQLVRFLGSMSGMEGRLGAAGGMEPEFVAGATISARAMRNAVLEGAKIVLRYRNETVPVTEPTVDMLNFRPMSADELIADGGIANVVVTNATLEAAMEKAGLGHLEPQVLPRRGADAVYLDLRAGYANASTIGRNSVGQGAYDRLYEPMRNGRHVLVFGSYGTYDFRGTQFNNYTHGFRLERITVTQGETEFEFHKSDLVYTDYSLGRVANALMLPESAEWDPFAPWRADIHAQARHPDGRLEPFHLTSLEYRLPPQYVLMPPSAPRAAWMEPWVQQRVPLVILGSALGLLTLILGFQGPLTRRRTLHRWVRLGFLGFTIVWLGWIASAQLSIVHLINYLQAPFQGLGLAFYLAEPLIVLISVYTAVSLIILGRGVFCGWLCPFGALQELLAHVARLFRLPQWNPSERLQRKLWWGKYASLVIVVGLAIVAPAAGAIAAEIEPFKTAITAIFQRGWPYVVYAVILLIIGLFTERAFCRFLCPLGGALAILGRVHLVDLLKRRPECGSPCKLCERACPVKAIERSGRIKMAECFQCLDCMVEYHDDRRCPPLAKLRKIRQRAQGAPGRQAPQPNRGVLAPRPAAAIVEPAE
ncbi:4Fe-4S binding protein [Roseitranquillus sediminis]|uniref:4Fe-4S binding protein n=1 Tax=Roseitranquillus sediminis TaxID=2809051 RepID=UPI001D0C45DF|nr:NosR/NirI family protein [Roseitranquillus sediminis]MBM9593194.1 4Fe-4S binding protein [Roseitranquillus sediminis]